MSDTDAKTTTRAAYLSPRQVAERFGVRLAKVMTWIRSGELRALNLAESLNGQRPRYKISLADLMDFETRRAVVPAPQRKTRSRPKQPKGWVNYF